MPTAKRPVRKSSQLAKAKAAPSAKARADRSEGRKAARKPLSAKSAPAGKAANKGKAKATTAKPASKPQSVAAKAVPSKAVPSKAVKVAKASAGKPAGREPKPVATAAKPQPVVREMIVRTTPGLVKTSGQKPLRPPQRASRRVSERYDPDALIHGIRPYQAKPGEAYMNPAQLEHFRSILRAWRRELMEEVDRTVHHMQDEASNFPDPNDRATQESEFGLELRTRDRERKLLKKIDLALERIEERAYGYCEETGEEIGLKRLEARPVATLSLEAQERREMAERQYGERDDHNR